VKNNGIFSHEKENYSRQGTSGKWKLEKGRQDKSHGNMLSMLTIFFTNFSTTFGQQPYFTT